nr:MobC family plasmid mobilization relaxosome protein [Streptomyces sp. TRM68416]
MHTENDTNPSSSRRWGWFSRDRRTAASWSERAPKEASSALAPAPGVAEGEGAGRQRAPEPEEGVNEPRTASTADSATQPVADSVTPHAEPSARQPRAAVEQPSWREPDAPALPARMNRKRTIEKRDQEKKIRFTPTAIRLIDAEAKRRHQKFAGFVGDAALAVALGKAGMVGSPEDDPIRPLVEAIEAHTKALNRIGTNLNQITAAVHSGAIPERTEAVLDRIEQAAQASYALMDRLLAEGAGHGA